MWLHSLTHLIMWRISRDVTIIICWGATRNSKMLCWLICKMLCWISRQPIWIKSLLILKIKCSWIIIYINIRHIKQRLSLKVGKVGTALLLQYFKNKWHIPCFTVQQWKYRRVRRGRQTTTSADFLQVVQVGFFLICDVLVLLLILFIFLMEIIMG